MYQVLERYLREELQERVPLKARRLVIHSTANPGVGDEAHYKWLDGARRHGWAHYYLDADSISQLVPEGLVAPAQGPTANADSISIEICEAKPGDRNEFIASWDRAVWLAADVIRRYGWTIDALCSHADISRQYPSETDHTDPLAYFQSFGRSWANFKADVASTLELASSEEGILPAPAAWQEQAIDDLMSAGLLQNRRHPNQVVRWWELALMLQRVRQ